MWLLITRGLSDLEKAFKTQDLREAALLIVYKWPDKKKIVETRFKLRREGLISQVRKTEAQLKDVCEDVENLIYDYLIISFTQFLEAIGEWPRVNT